MANTLALISWGAVGFIDRLDELVFMMVLWLHAATSASALAQ